MKHWWKTANFRMVAFAVALMVPTTVMVVYSPTLYNLFCSITGAGGKPRRALKAPNESALPERTVTVFFDSNIAPGLDWDFRPEQRKVVVHVGVPTRIYYYAHNRSKTTGVAQATYNVVPYKVSPYFFKIQCFCFTRERLGPGESARMPVVFYVDKHFLKDINMSEVHQITLSYTMFPQTDLTPEEVKAARDLAAGSRKTDSKLDAGDKMSFDNDAPRQ